MFSTPASVKQRNQMYGQRDATGDGSVAFWIKRLHTERSDRLVTGNLANGGEQTSFRRPAGPLGASWLTPSASPDGKLNLPAHRTRSWPHRCQNNTGHRTFPQRVPRQCPRYLYLSPVQTSFHVHRPGYELLQKERGVWYRHYY